MTAEIVVNLEKNAPDFFTRVEAARMLNGLICRGTLANLDSQGKGPGGKVIRGKRIYFKPEFIAWVKLFFGEEKNHA
ncbi:hypothetical protein LJC71_09080 [Desulfosarcina sp. OttesenSCG-928-A07]|nr:hypothetical protein [Desulfosarcina sp. OttesenSCG-928-G17]MDL2329877.1 hypothetical protein [Desulfosarcina sp. OttesenSCG-928-A07]